MERAEDPRYLSEQLITYLGNKRALLSFIGEALEVVKGRLGRSELRCFDVFSGSGVVSRYLKRSSSELYTGDLEPYCELISRCYLTNRESVNERELSEALAWVNSEAASRLTPGLIAELYAPRDDQAIQLGERVFYTRRNACFLDSARQLITELPTELQRFVLGPLLYKASVHANTPGVFKGFYKNSQTKRGQFGGNGRHALSRIKGEIDIPHPIFSAFSCPVTSYRGEAQRYAGYPRDLDLAYLDPPYNQHPYGSNYFMLNLLLSYERPEALSEVSGIPRDWRRSQFNQKRHALEALEEVVDQLDARFVLLSFSSEGHITRPDLEALLRRSGRLDTFERRYHTFRGSRNLKGRAGYVTELLYLLERA